MMKIRSLLCALALIGVLAFGISAVTYADTTDNTTYGSGGYGDCTFGACTITLTSGSTVNANVVPSASGACTIQSDTVSVLTASGSGYSLTMTTSTTNNAMTGSSGSINPSSGTAAAPSVLSMNTWGYRVDGLSGFGSGPTSAQNSGSVPGLSFAEVPASNEAPTQVASSATAATPAVNTTVWYGVCANTSLPSGNYAATVTYTAVTN